MSILHQANLIRTIFATTIGESTHGIVANVLVCDTIVSEFKLQSRYYVYLEINTFEKGMTTPLYPLQLWH